MNLFYRQRFQGLVFCALIVLSFLSLASQADDFFDRPKSNPLSTDWLPEANSFLKVTEAYILSPEVENTELRLTWEIKPGYYLYQERFKITDAQSQPLSMTFSPGIEKFDEFFSKDMVVHFSTATVFVTLPDTQSRTIIIESQGCAEAGLCYPPHLEAIEVNPASGIAAATPLPEPSSTNNNPAESETSLFFLQALLLALFGGIILNLMPCVFPVLSIKVMSLTMSEPSRVKYHGFAYTAGILVCFIAFGALLLSARQAGEALGWGFQLQSPALVIALTYLFFVMGLTLSGALNFGASLMGVGQSLSNKEGLKGSFFSGILAAVVASPCTAPFMGAALGYALTQPAAIGLSIFVALGLGMALPFLALCAFPSLINRLPAPGVWMENLKELLAFPLYLTAIWLIWVASNQIGSHAILIVGSGLLLISFAAWLLSKAQRAQRSLGLKVLAGLSLIAAIWLPLSNLNKEVDDSLWHPYSSEALQKLREAGKPVFVNLTADWCITCLANERVALSSTTVLEAIKEQQIATLKGDWTNADPAITQLLEDYRRSGVPLYLWFPSGHQGQGIILPQILTPKILLDTFSNK